MPVRPLKSVVRAGEILPVEVVVNHTRPAAFRVEVEAFGQRMVSNPVRDMQGPFVAYLYVPVPPGPVPGQTVTGYPIRSGQFAGQPKQNIRVSVYRTDGGVNKKVDGGSFVVTVLGAAGGDRPVKPPAENKGGSILPLLILVGLIMA